MIKALSGADHRKEGAAMNRSNIRLSPFQVILTGFLTWSDAAEHGIHLRRYRMQSKAILLTTAVLILLPTALLFFGEYAALPLRERLCLSLFQAITPRTAGFNTADLRP